MPFELNKRIAETRRRERKRFDCAISLTFNRLRDRAPRDTGELYASGRLGDFFTTPTKFGRVIVFAVDYASYLDTGTGPHRISVRTASVLTNGDQFFGTSVDHPGSTLHKGWFSDNAQEEFHNALVECGARL